MAVAGLLLASAACLLLACQRPSAPASAPRVVFVSYLDVPHDPRGRMHFETFASALRRLDRTLAATVELEFVQASVTHGSTIDDVMRKVVATRPTAIIATSDDVLLSARALTDTIPVLFATHADPVAAGHVRSIASPGVARTGFTYHLPLTRKMIEVLLDAYPGTRRIGILADPARAGELPFQQDLAALRQSTRADVALFTVTHAAEVRAALNGARGAVMDAWYFPVGEALWNDEHDVLELMRNTGKPVLFERERWARDAGGMSYEPRVRDPFGILASQLLLVLNGADVRTIPVERPSEFELAISVPAASTDHRLQPSKNVVMRANRILKRDPQAYEQAGLRQ